MIASQVVCGAGNACTTSLKSQFGVVGGLEYTQKLNDNALKSTESTLNSVQRKATSSRFRWIAQCISATRLGEVYFRCFFPHEYFSGSLQIMET